MLKDITLGQYFPGDTVIHRLDPRTKLVMTIVYMVALFTAKDIISYGVVMAGLAAVIVVSNTKLKMLLKGLKPIVIVLAFTGILNILYAPGEHVIAHFWVFTITLEGIKTAILMMLRITMLIMGTSILTYTTSPIALTDGMERLMGPLKKIKVPVHEISMIMSIALRFIPTLIEETDKIMNAQRARGADFDSGNLIQRAKAMLPILVPLFISAFRRADELAIAMESRCYHGGEGRTRMKVLKYKRRDIITFILGIAYLTAVIVLRKIGL